MHSLQTHIQSIQRVECAVNLHSAKVDCLLKLDLGCTSVVDFGCHVGYETIALAWGLGLLNAVGIDKAKASVDQASSTARYFVEEIGYIEHNLYYGYNLPKDLRKQAQEILAAYQHRAMPRFLVADVTAAPLQDNQFDLAFCERLLYHIACQGAASADIETQIAVSEMARVVTPGGHVVAIEPCECSVDDRTPVLLEGVFLQVGLLPLEYAQNPFSVEGKQLYLFQKPTVAA